MKRLVAIVDDDSRVLESLEDLLESVGHEVHAYSAGQQALSDPAFPAMDCLVTDIAMPGMDGMELSRMARQLCPSLPIILITAHEVSDQAAVSAAVSCLLRKPFIGQDLLNAIRRAIGD